MIDKKTVKILKGYYQNEKDEFYKEIYLECTPINGALFDTKNKNWQIKDGIEYAQAILVYENINILKDCLKNKSIKFSTLRQDKKTDEYFWIGMKLVKNSKELLKDGE